VQAIEIKPADVRDVQAYKAHEETMKILIQTKAELKETESQIDNLKKIVQTLEKKILSCSQIIMISQENQDYHIQMLFEQQTPLPALDRSPETNELRPGITMLHGKEEHSQLMYLYEGPSQISGYVRVTGPFGIELKRVSELRIELTVVEKLRLARDDFQQCLKAGVYDCSLLSPLGRAKLHSLDLQNMCVLYVYPGGDCFYLCLSYGTRRNFVNAQYFRDLVVSKYHQDPSKTPFARGVDMGGNARFDTFEEYCCSISHSAYATDSEIKCLASELDLCVVIMRLVRPEAGTCKIVCQTFNEDGNQIMVVAHYETHYDLILSKDYKTKINKQPVEDMISSFRPRRKPQMSQRFNPITM